MEQYEFGSDFSKWYITRAAASVWHVFPPVLRAENGYVFDVLAARFSNSIPAHRQSQHSIGDTGDKAMGYARLVRKR